MSFRSAHVALAFVAMFLAAITFDAEASFCWRDSYGRGAGTIPTGCAGSKGNDAGLCYTACPAGRVGVGPACHSNCPSGWTPVGADPTAVSCWKPKMAKDKSLSYGRTAGYALWDEGKCKKEHGQGCEKGGALWYPKCRAGYTGVGPVCWQSLKSCPSGWRDDGLACAKPALAGRGAGTIPTECAGGKQNDAGLCYTACKATFSGAGPVCWGQCPPSSPINCGAGCAATSDECAKAITDQVVSVLDVAVTIASTVATGGGAAAGKAAATTAAKTAAKAAAKSAAKQAVVKGAGKAAIKAEIKKLAKDAGKDIAESSLENLASMAAGEDFDPYDLDPTGIASVVKAYNKPICGKK